MPKSPMIEEVARRLQHSARSVREWMAQDCPPEDTPRLAIALLAEFARSVADDHMKRTGSMLEDTP